MPGPIVHLIVQERLSSQLREFGGREVADLLDAEKCDPYAAFGSMGPDFLFFSMREYGNAIGDLTNFIFNVYDAFEPIITFYEDNIEPVIDDIEDAIKLIDQTLFQGIFERIKDTANLTTTTLLTAAGTVITRNIDLFYLFYPKIQQGKREKDWYWFDFLHYRRTGYFANEMWNLASNDNDLKRYVLGYVSHIATDVVGHPYVNAITGGPYRTHWHRHKLVENWIDAYARRFYPDGARRIDCLDLKPDEQYIANAISRSYYYRLVEFPNTGAVKNLPPKLTKLFVDAMQNTYAPLGTDLHPPMLSTADVDDAYRLWIEWFKRSTMIGDFQLPPPPPPPPGSATIALINSYASGLPSLPGGPPSGGGFSLSGILAALFAFASYLVSVLIYTLDWIINNTPSILALPYTEALALANWFIYQVQKALFEIYDNLRFMLVLGAYLFPEPRDLAKFPWGLALTNTGYAHLTGGGNANNFTEYPFKQETHSLYGTTEHHLIYPPLPQVASETPSGIITGALEGVETMPAPFYIANPEVFISFNYPYNPFIEYLYSCKGPYGIGARFTHAIDQQTWQTHQLGSALGFSARLIIQRLGNLPNFNLDGDRGYGWKTWRVDGIDPKTDDLPPQIETTTPVNVVYIDP